MKKLLLTLGLVAATSAQAQGTIQFANNAGTRFLINGVRALGGAGRTEAGDFIFGVFAGSTADAISDQPAGPLGANTATGGLITAPNPDGYEIAGFESGATVFLQFRGWESSFGSDWQAARAGGLYGETAVRSVVLGYPGYGTAVWSSTEADKFQAINLVPEPSTMVLAGVGTAGLLVFRRRR